MTWEREDCLLLIKEYESRRLLWDRDHKLYRSRVQKMNAWREISVVLSRDVATLKAKIVSLRSSRGREKRRILKRKAKGIYYLHLGILIFDLHYALNQKYFFKDERACQSGSPGKT